MKHIAQSLHRTAGGIKVALLLFPVLVLFSACEKEITVDLPEMPTQLVVEGTIEPDAPPFVVLTRTQSYFAPTDLNTLASMFVGGATITVTADGSTWTLEEVPSNALSAELRALAAEHTGLDPMVLALVGIPVYTLPAGELLGVAGTTYRMDIASAGTTLSAVSTIPHPVALDSVWFELALERPGDDSLGYAWARITDPDTLGNGYRWMAQRINRRANGAMKDPSYISPLGSSYDDKYINGLTFEFTQIRGRQYYSGQPEDDNEELGYFKVGDTIAVKALSIGKKEYDFYSSYDTNVGSAGDLFTTPANVKSNITGGLGIWAGRGVYLDTIVCVP